MPTAEQLTADLVRASRHELRLSLNKIKEALGHIRPEQAWQRAHENENAIGNLLLHLAGNVRQWIVCGLGGAEGERDRPAEFAQREPLPIEEVFAKLESTVAEAEAVLEEMAPAALLKSYPIQVYEVSGIHAILHVVTHFAEHTGQILWAVKRLTGDDLGLYSHLDAQPEQAGETGQP